MAYPPVTGSASMGSRTEGAGWPTMDPRAEHNIRPVPGASTRGGAP